MSGDAFRLPAGGRIDRARPLRFSFDGVPLTGYAGDTLASALLANGVRLVGRSFKYHRPRGLMASGVEEPNALVTIGTGAWREPNLKATEVELYDGLAAASQNAWPTLRHDIGALAGIAPGLLPAGFYYKTFMWPSWRPFEGPIRRAAGLGVAPNEPDPSRYETMHAHCDVLVVGAGPAGLAAATAALATGARVILAEQRPECGGALLASEAEAATLAELLAGLDAAATRGELRRIVRATVTGYHDHNLLTMIERVTDHLGRAAPAHLPRQRLWLIRAKAVVLATGALERPLPFPGNDRPGIMLAGAVRDYVARFAVLPGRRAVIATDNDSAYETALALAAAGATVAAVVERRATASEALAGRLAALGIETLANAVIRDTRGRAALASVTVGAPGGGARRRIACDLLAMSGGWTPTVHLVSQSGGGLRYDEAGGRFLPDRSAQNERSAGAARGLADTHDCIADGEAAGADAARSAGFGTAATRARPAPAPKPASPSLAPWWGKRGRAVFVDFQNDVTAADIELAARENYVSVEHLKRYTTLGMAVDQGKTSNVNGLALLAAATGRPVAEVGTTRFRPPYTPATLGNFAGREVGDAFQPKRLLPAHDHHLGLGATMEEYGGWQRPALYARPGESQAAAIRREVLAVRTGVGLFDASPLGKIEVAGPDAGLFLERIYANSLRTLAAGRLRYGLMLNENGVVIDDGVAARLAPDRYLVGTTSSGAARIGDWLEEWHQCEWPELRLVIAPVTTTWATLALAGPKARDVLAGLGTSIDLAPGAFPHLSLHEGRVAGLPARIARVSFSGELSYEVSVPWSHGEALWTRCLALGEAFGIAPIGVEAWMVLRTEKGFLHVGVDTDGTTAPDDIGFGPAVARKSGDFVGRRSLTRTDNKRPDRLQLVGVEPVERQARLAIGAHLVAPGARPAKAAGGVISRVSQGFVTSACDSPTLGRWIGLALVASGRSRLGEVMEANDLGERTKVRLVERAFYDPAGERLDG